MKEMNIYIHPTAAVSPQASIGAGTTIWHHAQIREQAELGCGCVVGKGVYIDRGVKIGDRVKIQNYVSIYRGVTIEDDAFIGPHVTFTNDLYPRSFNQDWQVIPTHVERGASIGANATICCGITLGSYSMIGAGAVVTCDIPPYALAVGNPARIIGRVDKSGRPVYYGNR